MSEPRAPDRAAGRPAIALLTREYPPHVYGGAGVHVAHLARALARDADVRVRCFGDEPARVEDGVTVEAFAPWDALAGEAPYRSALRAVSVDVAMAAGLESVDLVHSHTWYANLAGHLAKIVHGIPHVLTTHSLEPLRPWKAEQLGPGGYALSSFCERIAIGSADAVIAVSAAMREDVLRVYPEAEPQRVTVVHNGVDAEAYRPDPATDVLDGLGVRTDRPIVTFVGRISRQKGLQHLLDAADHIDPGAQIVLCATSPDTPGELRETAERVERLRRARGGGVWWLDRMLDERELVQVLSHTTAFCCPSLYEPLGIVNLEAMACEAAVVASAVGGIPEVVEDGRTGLLVPFAPRPDGAWGPRDPDGFAHRLAEAVNTLVGDPARAAAMGRAGRERVLDRFTWTTVAARTLHVYRAVLGA